MNQSSAYLSRAVILSEYGWIKQIDQSRRQILHPRSPLLGLQYLLEVPDAVVAAEAFLLAIDQQEMVGWRSAGQVVAALLAAVHDQPVGPAVNVETCVAADLMSHSLKANFVPDL